MGYIIEQKWSPTRRRFIKRYIVRTDNRKIYESSSYMGAVRWLRKRQRK